MNKDRKRLIVQQGDLIVALYDEAEKVTKEKRIQLLLVRLALADLKLRNGLHLKNTSGKGNRAA